MRDCIICGSEDNYESLCHSCGQFLYQDELLHLHSDENKKMYREKYEVVYKVLNDKYEELKNQQSETRMPQSSIELIKRLPEPKNANIVDIICIAESISCSYLESFYQSYMDNIDMVLGDYVRKEILYWPEHNFKPLANLSIYARTFFS